MRKILTILSLFALHTYQNEQGETVQIEPHEHQTNELNDDNVGLEVEKNEQENHDDGEIVENAEHDIKNEDETPNLPQEPIEDEDSEDTPDESNDEDEDSDEDSNEDEVTKEEIQELFNIYDTNDDNVVSREELIEGATENVGEDKEALQQINSLFSQVDDENNGLDVEEFGQVVLEEVEEEL